MSFVGVYSGRHVTECQRYDVFGAHRTCHNMAVLFDPWEELSSNRLGIRDHADGHPGRHIGQCEDLIRHVKPSHPDQSDDRDAAVKHQGKLSIGLLVGRL